MLSNLKVTQCNAANIDFIAAVEYSKRERRIDMTTGEKISEGRKKLGLTQQQFADELGVTRQAVSRWESDFAFPETDKLIKMSEMFGCTTDYLLKYNQSNVDTSADDDEQKCQPHTFNPLKWSFEYKSKRQLCGMPLVHINIGFGRRAHGFFSVGLISSGIFSLGLLSAGVISLGLLSLGLISLGLLVLGGVAVGSIALGVLALGGVAVGIMALGGLAIGCFSFGGCSIGLFAFGGYANGHYVAIGDYAVGRIAFGKTTANGSRLSITPQSFGELKEEAWRLMDELPNFWKGLVSACKKLAQATMMITE